MATQNLKGFILGFTIAFVIAFIGVLIYQNDINNHFDDGVEIEGESMNMKIIDTMTYTVNGEEKTAPVYAISGITTNEAIALLNDKSKTEFNDKLYEEQVEIIDNGYFSSCFMVKEFCAEYPETKGCIKYCEGKY